MPQRDVAIDVDSAIVGTAMDDGVASAGNGVARYRPAAASVPAGYAAHAPFTFAAATMTAALQGSQPQEKASASISSSQRG